MIKRRKASSGIWIIAIIFFLFLIFIYIPRINSPGIPAKQVKQISQFHSIGIALEFFKDELGELPPSDSLDPNGIPYCGAMKLAEAMLGQDLMGIHPDSVFRSDGKGLSGDLYNDKTYSRRKGPYLPIENANAYRIDEIYNYSNYVSQGFSSRNMVLCGVFKTVANRNTNEKIGMPILYYKADTSKSSHDVNNPDNPDNIYNYKDNYDLLALGVPGKPGVKHPLYEDPSLFYIMTQNTRTEEIKPYNKDTYILISAGKDGLYGTSDDIANFEFKWRANKDIKK